MKQNTNILRKEPVQTIKCETIRESGEVNFNYTQKEEAEIKNELLRKNIERALRRCWLLEFDNIRVRVADKRIFLSGIVSSFSQKEQAEKIARNTPGVWHVDNELIVEFS